MPAFPPTLELLLQIIAGGTGIGFGIGVLALTISTAAAVAYGLGYGGRPSWWGGLVLIPGVIVAAVGGLGLRNGLLALGSTPLHLAPDGPEPSPGWLALQTICVAGPTCFLLFYVLPTWLQARRLRLRLGAEVRASVSGEAPPTGRPDAHEEQQERR